MSLGSRVPKASSVSAVVAGAEGVGDAGAGRARDDAARARPGAPSSPSSSVPSPSRTTNSSSSAAWQCGGPLSAPGATTRWPTPVRAGPERVAEVAAHGDDVAAAR